MAHIRPALTARAAVAKALTDTVIDSVVDTVKDTVADVITRPSEPGEKPTSLAVIVPMYNEAATITPTLDALRAQTRPADFAIFCNNASTDDTADVVNTYIAEHALPWTVITETQKGTGAAADTAVRTAISMGASHIARTDADCLPAPDWLEQIDRVFTEDPVQLSLIHI
jgi:cellulose synthase/poly-beta-1,6-N-acetylglucosamine synthase-like glycosyltransferase